MGEDRAYAIPEDVVEVSTSELRRGLRDLLERVAFGDDELVVMRAGKPIAAVVSMDAYVALRNIVERYENAVDADAVLAADKESHFVDFEEVVKG